MRKRAIIIPWEEDIKKGKTTITFKFHGEIYGTILIINMEEK